MTSKGKVYIIGAGPGDPELLTLKARRVLALADVIIYDYLVNPEILLFRRTAKEKTLRSPQGKTAETRLIYAGKQGGDHTLSQEEINDLLVREASQGQVVARLKGGDPFVFGRGGEEAEILAERGIPFEVVPGVTSAVAAAAYAGIPLTHRNATSTLALVTGHEDPQKGKSDIDWEALGRMGTLVFLMGVKNLPFIVNKLLEAGKERACPAALIRWGTTPRQETLTGTLGDIVTRAQDAGVRPPAIFVVGPVVALREKLAWFDRQPLFGKTVLVTRPQAQAEGLSRLLAAEGARVITLPTIEILPVEDYRYLDLALTNIQTYDWLIFTSANGVRFFLRRLWERGGDLRDLKGLKICCIGPATAKAVEARGIRVDLVPDSYISEGVAAALIARGMAGAQVLLPRAEIARDVIPQELTRAGADVDVVAVYRTRLLPHPPEQLLDIMLDLDVVTFTSPSTVAGFMAIWGERPWPERVRVACLGPVTGQAATRAGLDVHIEEDVFTIEALVAGIRAYFAPAGK